MHRSTTTATLLVTVALSALSGCVTVQRPAAPAPAAPSPATVPRPEGRAHTQVVQAPAREALEMVGPSRKPLATTIEERRRQRSGPDAPPAPVERAPRTPAGRQSQPHHAQPRPDRPRRPAPAPRVEIPDVAAEVRRDTDVCALGRRYGGWRGDSPEAVICDQAYGR